MAGSSSNTDVMASAWPGAGGGAPLWLEQPEYAEEYASDNGAPGQGTAVTSSASCGTQPLRLSPPPPTARGAAGSSASRNRFRRGGSSHNAAIGCGSAVATARGMECDMADGMNVDIALGTAFTMVVCGIALGMAFGMAFGTVSGAPCFGPRASHSHEAA